MRRAVLQLLIAGAVLAAVPGPGVARGSDDVELAQRVSRGLAEVAAQVKPGVVAIITRGTVTVAMRHPFSGTPFAPFFDVPKGEGQPREFDRSGQGSGVIVQHRGETYILTNDHVIKGADEIQIQLANDSYYSAEVVGADSLSDVAVLRVTAAGLPTVPLGRSADLRDGEMVLAIGNPLGYEHSVTYGIISATGRDRFSRDEYGSYIQTDAAINPGNSGGALVNLQGELVGLNTAIVSRSGGYEGIGFAIPVDYVRDVMQQLLEYGEVRRGRLGAYIGDIDPTVAEGLGLPNTWGAEIRQVVGDGPAAAAGLEVGDIVLAMDDEPVRNASGLKARIGATQPGTRVELRVLRDGAERKVRVTLGEMTAAALAAGPEGAAGTAAQLGLSVQDLTAEIARSLGTDDENGVVVTDVAQGTEASRRGIRRGDIVREVNKRPVSSVADYRVALEGVEPGQVVLMLVESPRERSTRYVGLRMPGSK